MRKRTEIFSEFLYYVFDSFLIPLIRSNFYVTESNVHRYRLFFFRHDIWRYIAEPAIASLKVKIFEEVRLEDALRILDSRQLGFSQVRLLPKESTMRPITNLRRRTLAKGDKKILGPSINTILGPVHTMLNLEKVRLHQRLMMGLRCNNVFCGRHLQPS
jgi:telomerase reverse transcriptase